MVNKVIAFILTVTAFYFPISDGIAEDNTQNKGPLVIAYYFHGSFRCPTCHNLERYAKEAIENNFKEELNDGKLVFKTVNVEEKGNEHFINDYQLYTKSLVLSLVEDGKEIKHKNLANIWDYVRDKKKYTDYVKSEIADFLRGME